MRSNTIASVLCLFALLCATSVAAQSLRYKTGTYDDMKKEAQKTSNPFLIIFENKDCQECEEFENTTLRSELLTDFLNANFTVYKIDAFSYEGIGTVQLFDVKDYPTVMIFDIEGNGRTVSGIENPNEFHKQVKYALLNNLNQSRPVNEPMTPSPSNTPKDKDAEYVIAENGAKPKIIPKTMDEFPMSVERGEAAALQLTKEEIEADELEQSTMSESVLSDIPGMNKYSVKEKKPQGFAIKVGTYTTVEALKAEAGVYDKKWKNQVWVYTQERQGAKQYCLALGVYEDKESAQYIRRLLYESFSLPGSIITLNDIRY